MRVFGIIVLVGLQVLAFADANPKVDESRIVGGQNANLGQFKYQASLRSNGRHFCGGSIISKRTILTAAHCNVYPISTVRAVVGTVSSTSGSAQHSVSSFIVHPGWNANTLENDIAVIILKEDIQFNENVQKVDLPTSNLPDGGEAVASGWGLTSYPGSVPERLQWITLRSISNANCKSIQSSIVHATQICTLTKRGEGVCSGDSGGPLVANGQIQGVTSAAYLCALGLPDFFTRVYSFVDWVQANMQQ